MLQRVRPDVVLLNEFDYVENYRAVDLFREQLPRAVPAGRPPDPYPYAFTAPSNTGIPTGFDLDRNGTVGGGNDAFGFGEFPGQYGMVVLSRYPIDPTGSGPSRLFRWADMPGALLPDDPATAAPPTGTPPRSSRSSGCPASRTGTSRCGRSQDGARPRLAPDSADVRRSRGPQRHPQPREIRFWADYVTPGAGRYIYDDEGRRGGLRPGSRFVIMGDQNADPLDGDSVDEAINQLLDSRWIPDPKPTSAGAVEAARLQGGANLTHRGNPAYDTADFNDNPAPGQPAGRLRPAVALGPEGEDSGVFWPVRSDPLSRLTGEFPFPTSDHRLVWVDLRIR